MLTINRRTVNLLTSARLYLDHLPQNIKLCVRDNSAITAIKSRHYDNSFSYRFMEALRNYVQHCGLGIHLITTGSKVLSSEKEGEVEFSFSAFSCKTNLRESGNFKKIVLEEMPDNVNIIAASRSYIDCIRSIHSDVREIIHDAAISARAEIKQAINEHSILNSGNEEALKIAKIERQENSVKTIEEYYLLLEWDDHRIKLHEKNRSNGVTSITGIENWYIRSV